ncbi:class I SAM-dependent methyltransferase [Streptomyces sp. NPDC089799]|uniref:SAM-dependent methyltransferase n=1 Tax=Streptomyces sp. NPDC089799 TaxID=3155066 RepID=UPI003423FF49
MKREEISALAHAHHPIAAPVDDEAVRHLLEGGLRGGARRVLDLGCGGGEWLLRALTADPGVLAEGVDRAGTALARAREAATRLGVGDRLVLHHRDASDFAPAHAFDLVLCVGSTHALGGLLPTLAAARKHLAPGGRVLVGDAFWAEEPSTEAAELLGDLDDLPTVMDRVTADGWVPVQGHISSRRELDAYEWAWTGSLAEWALDHPAHPDSARALEEATVHRDEWLRVYRAAFGFVSLVLRPGDH